MVQLDLTGMVIDAMIQFWMFIPIILLAPILKTAWFKGVVGEFLVNMMLNRLPKDDYHLVKNITLPTEDGTTQIDQVLISKYGIFIIETKNMRGWIFGTAKQKQWSQKLFKKTYKFQNPIHQNYKHLKTLESLLDVDQEALFSVVVFIGQSEFKTKMPPNVTYATGCLTYIKSMKKELLSQQQVERVISIIDTNRLEQSFATNRAHVKHVKSIVENKKA